MNTLWGGRFDGDMDDLMWEFNASIDFDRRLAKVDVQGSIAYAEALRQAGVLAAAEAEQIVEGLELVAKEIERGDFSFESTDEDIHTAVERRLGELIGPLAGKLHTGRSRNDQVATDIRLYLMGRLDVLEQALVALQRVIVDRAERLLDLLMPGYTHLQLAQPVRFSHWLMSFFWMLQRDRERMVDFAKRVSRCPLGAAALAGNTYGLDREALAKALGFEGVCYNSMDAVSDRDMMLETLNWGAILGIHLSRLAEDLIIWSTKAFGFVLLDERYATGSSIMPQKRNPDSLELVRGKTGRLIGNLTALLTTVKGIPSTYDKDLQEDKEPLFDTLDTLGQLLPVVSGVIDTMQVNEEAMLAALDEATLATDLADYLVQKGVPFREAHHLIGQVVKRCETEDLSLSALPLEAYQEISSAFEESLYEVLDFEASVEAHDALGGTARSAVVEQIARARQLLDS